MTLVSIWAAVSYLSTHINYSSRDSVIVVCFVGTCPALIVLRVARSDDGPGDNLSDRGDSRVAGGYCNPVHHQVKYA